MWYNVVWWARPSFLWGRHHSVRVVFIQHCRIVTDRIVLYYNLDFRFRVLAFFLRHKQVLGTAVMNVYRPFFVADVRDQACVFMQSLLYTYIYIHHLLYKFCVISYLLSSVFHILDWLSYTSMFLHASWDILYCDQLVKGYLFNKNCM